MSFTKFSADFFFGVAIIKVTFFYENTPLVSFIKCLLFADDLQGEPGSINRNPFIAAIFHETNLAETKGSGIRTMRRLMEDVSMMPPTFESDRENNRFTVRLLLHHLLNENDLMWLKYFDNYNLTDNQKRILVFIREVGAVDNSSARQINGSEPNITNIELRKLRELKLLDQKGGNRHTFYLPSELLKNTYSETVEIQADTGEAVLGALPKNLSTLPKNLSALPIDLSTLPTESVNKLSELIEQIKSLPQRINDKSLLANLILQLCEIHTFKLNELADIIGKSDKYILREFIKPLLNEKKINYKYPDMINHPDQAYLTINKMIH